MNITLESLCQRKQYDILKIYVVNGFNKSNDEVIEQMEDGKGVEVDYESYKDREVITFKEYDYIDYALKYGGELGADVDMRWKVMVVAI